MTVQEKKLTAKLYSAKPPGPVTRTRIYCNFMSFHSQLWPKDPHVLCSYVTERGFQDMEVCSWHTRSHPPHIHGNSECRRKPLPRSLSPAHCRKGQARRQKSPHCCSTTNPKFLLPLPLKNASMKTISVLWSTDGNSIKNRADPRMGCVYEIPLFPLCCCEKKKDGKYLICSKSEAWRSPNVNKLQQRANSCGCHS